MIEGQYVVLRIVPDIARNEPINVGILGWSHGHACLRVDDSALDRVLQYAPNWEPDAFEDFARNLESRILNSPLAPSTAHWETALREAVSFPITTTESMRMMLKGESSVESELFNAIDRLCERLVHVRRRSYRQSPSIVEPIKDRLRFWIENEKVSTKHKFIESRSGIERSVKFFANSSVNVVLDTLVAQRNAKEEGVIAIADAFVSKVNDIRGGNDSVRDFLVYYPSDQRPSLNRYREEVEKLIETGCECKFFSDFQRASDEMVVAIETY